MQRIIAHPPVSRRAAPVVMLGRRLRLIALVSVAAVFAAVAVGFVVGGAAAHSPVFRAMTKMSPMKQDPPLDRHAWALQYGQDLRTMPDLPDVNAATPEERAAATDLLLRTRAATAAYADPAAAEAAGYARIGAVARAGQDPGIAAAIASLASVIPSNMRMLHISNTHPSGAVLDPNSPDDLMYAYMPDGSWMLHGVMFIGNAAYPGPPPTPGGPITRWHYHSRAYAQNLMMHMFFVPDNDLAQSFAANMPPM